jgi:predicted PurR-regulated permease PerM
MKFPDVVPVTSELRVFRAGVIALIFAIVIAAAHFGRDVLVPAAVAALVSFMLGPVVTWVRRLLPAPLAVAVVLLGALLLAGATTVLFMTQLADVAVNLTGYQANLQQKIKDVRSLAEGGGALSRLVAMIASLANDFTPISGATEAPVRVQAGNASSFAVIAAFIGPVLQAVLTIGIVIILVIFILLDRDHLSDQLVRLFGASDVHATSKAINDAGGRVARMLSLQLVTNLGFSVVVGLGLFALGLPNAALWGLMAGGLRFVPYVGAALGAVLPTVIAFAVMPGWMQPLFVLGWIVLCDIVIGQLIEPWLFGESTGVTPLALILSALFWGLLWGPVGLLLSTPITICLLVLATHVPHLGFLQVMLGDEPALAPHQQIYRRLIRKAVAEASTVALAEIEANGPDKGLDDGMGRMVVLAANDHSRDRLSADQVEAVVDGTDEVLDFLGGDERSGELATGEHPASGTAFRCIGGRGQIDEAAAAVMAFALRGHGLKAETRRRTQAGVETEPQATSFDLICYATHPSSGVVRYTTRKLALSGTGRRALHLVVDYDAAAAPIPKGQQPNATHAGGITALARLVAEHAAAPQAQP